MIGELRFRGYYVVPKVLTAEQCAALKAAAYEAQAGFRAEVGDDRAKRAREVGVVRAPMKYHPAFYDLLTTAAMLQVVDQELSATAVLHLQNVFILPPDRGENVFQTTFHRDFPRYMGSYRASLNVFVAVTEFTEQNGALRVVPGSHQLDNAPDTDYLADYSVPVACPAGSMIVFDSTLWHASGVNRSTTDRIGVNHQFCRSFLKPQLDYVRLLGEESVLSRPKRTQQLLGWFTRVPASLDEYYRPEAERVYRKGQG